MRSSGPAELRKASSRRGYLHPFRSFSTSRVPRHVEPSPEREEKPKKEGRGSGGGFFSQLRRSLTLGHRSSSSSSSSSTAAGSAVAPPAASSKEGAAPAWGKRMKNGLAKPLKVVRTSYVDCMMGIAEDPRMEGIASMQPNSTEAYAFQSSSSRRSSSSSAQHELVYPIDAQLQALLRRSKHHAHVFSSQSN